MYTNGFNTEGLFIMPKVEKGNDLNRFCRLEGMDYSQLASEVRGIRNRLEKSRAIRFLTGHADRSH